MGVAELDQRTKSTVYCTLVFISRDGEILGKHRKLKPTFHERTAWGEGDGSGLRVYERPYGRISGLNCWEHQMMLPGYALAMQGTQIHVAAWPGREPDAAPPAPVGLWPRQTLLSRAFASQAGAYVILASAMNRKADYPAELRPDTRRALQQGRLAGLDIVIQHEQPEGELAPRTQGRLPADRAHVLPAQARARRHLPATTHHPALGLPQPS